MDEDDIKRRLEGLYIPAPDAADRQRTTAAAFERLQRAGRPERHGWRAATRGLAFGCAAMLCLFSVLSYMVTQSSRSGGGDVSSEKSLVSGSALTQYPAGVRTAILHQVVAQGVKAEALRFNTLDEFQYLGNPKISVFHPQGGAAAYRNAPSALMADGKPGVWTFNTEIAIAGLGSDAPELAAYLVGVSRKVCEQTDRQLGIPAIPRLEKDLSRFYTKRMVTLPAGDYALPADPQTIDQKNLAGRPFACVEAANDGVYVYYHVLIER